MVRLTHDGKQQLPRNISIDCTLYIGQLGKCNTGCSSGYLDLSSGPKLIFTLGLVVLAVKIQQQESKKFNFEKSNYKHNLQKMASPLREGAIAMHWAETFSSNTQRRLREGETSDKSQLSLHRRKILRSR